MSETRMTDNELRVQLMIALHGRCMADWARRRANGAVAITQHGVDAHREQADAVIPLIRKLLDE